VEVPVLLNLDGQNGRLRLVFSLAEELKMDPDRVFATQQLTMDRSRPELGLKGDYGLFGSAEWWGNVEGRKMPLIFIEGRILRAYPDGQDADINNSVDIVCPDGSVKSIGIYVNDEDDVEYFSEGHWLEMVYALDKLKKQPASDGGVNYSKVAIEVAVSETPLFAR
jgi:hypothetical protein